MRHLAIGGGILRELNDLRGPMSAVLDHFVAQNRELEKYKQRFGSITPDSITPDSSEGEEDLQEVEGTDAEQE